MSGFSLDDSGEARLAVAEIFRDHGLAGLDDEPLVGRLLPDLLPESPREASLLKSAAGANVGQMLTDRFQAGIPADAAVRDVATILAGRLAFDANACLWIVSEYALVLGHPVDLSPAKAAPTTPPAKQQPAAGQQAAAQQGAQQAAAQQAAAQQAAAQQAAARQAAAQQAAARQAAAQQKPAPPTERKAAAANLGPRPVPEATYADPYAHYAPGRAGAVAVDPHDDNTTSLRVPPAGSKLPLVLGILVTLAVVAAIVVAVVIKLNPSSCTGSSCTTTSRTTPPVNTSHSSSPSPSPSPTGPKVAALASIMPKDISVADDCTADSNTTLPTATGYYHCTESDTSKMAGLAFWAYQFADSASFNAGVQSFNQFIKFDPNNSGSSCPPASGDTNGLHSWHFKDNPDIAQGIVECYSVTNNTQHVYRWTDDRDLTIMFAESAAGQSWTDLSGWWSDNINNTPDA